MQHLENWIRVRVENVRLQSAVGRFVIEPIRCSAFRRDLINKSLTQSRNPRLRTWNIQFRLCGRFVEPLRHCRRWRGVQARPTS